MVRVTNIRIPVDKDGTGELERCLCRHLNIRPEELLRVDIFKQSIDARRSNVFFVYTVDVQLENEERVLAAAPGKASRAPEIRYQYVDPGSNMLPHRPVIVGTGPAGLFAGLILARMGYRPLLLERGKEVHGRAGTVSRFWSDAELDPECSVQFGEGGAGTFSDGKLTTQTRDPRNRFVLEELVKAGAPPEVLYSTKPHVGTDRLRTVVEKMRDDIISSGGEYLFQSKVTDIKTSGGGVTGLVVNGSTSMDARIIILACGHSARDTYQMLHARGVNMVPKAFSIGVRIEHPQGLIDRVQYGSLAGHPKLGAADYKLAYHSSSGRTAYTFCMCPGGVVVAAASEPETVTTNGMRFYARDGENANSALLVNVCPEDFPGDSPLAGIDFQRRWERSAYSLGGGDYHAPVQVLGNFLRGKASSSLGGVCPTYRPGITPADLRRCLPGFVVKTLMEAVPYLDKKLKGLAMEDAVLTGVETRSSSPVRIVRDETYQSNIRGLYPAGEGSGYSGGIVSSAVDGIKTAEMIISTYSPLE